MTDEIRHLASIRSVHGHLPIPNADRIEVSQVDGWETVTKKGEFAIGDKGVYFEIDSFLPDEPRYAFLKNSKEFHGKRGYRLRTVKLRGQLSQGLLLPLSDFPELAHCELGEDVTERLGVVKWEAEIPASLMGEMSGTFPSFIPKTDEERIQNLIFDSKAREEILGHTFEVTQKIDGTSMTVYLKDGHFGVCGRNWEFKDTVKNTYWQMAESLMLKERLEALGKNIALQGELFGAGIQGNPEGIVGQQFRIFNIYAIDECRYLGAAERHDYVERLSCFPNLTRLSEVPNIGVKTFDAANLDLNLLLKEAEGKSQIGTNEREGLVYKREDGKFSFKVINNLYLLQEK